MKIIQILSHLGQLFGLCEAGLLHVLRDNGEWENQPTLLDAPAEGDDAEPPADAQ